MNGSSDPDFDDAPAPAVDHVLHVADRSVCARFGPMLGQLTQGLCATGVHTALLTDDPQTAARFQRSPVDCHTVPHLSGWRAWGLGGYLASHFAPPPDVVHVWGTAGLGAVQRWASGAGVPVLVHVLGMTHVERLIRTGVGRSHVVAASAMLAGQFPSGVCRCRAIRLAVAPPVTSVRAGPPDHTFSVLCVTHGAEGGGLEALVDAVAQLRRNKCDLQVGLVGGGPDVSAVWRRIRTQDVRECVSLVDDPALWEKVLPEVDACVVPGPQRELSIVPLLAMALGKVVIAARDQLGEWFIEDQTAWQFTPGSAVELAYLLSRAIEHPKRAHDLGLAAAEYVRAHHSIRDMIAALQEVYTQVVEGAAAVSTGTTTEAGRDAAGA
jgi:hypothetical protein